MLSLLKEKNPSLEAELDEAYLGRLQTIPQSLLNSELQQLENSASAAQDALEKLVSSHSSSFVQLKGILDTITAGIDDLGQANLLKQGSRIDAKRAYELSDLLLKQDFELYANIEKIEELVGLPKLIETCVAAGNYTQALDLAAFARRLASRYANSKLINRIAAESSRQIELTLGVLTRLLRETPKLPVLIKVATLLRKMEPFKRTEDSNDKALLDLLWTSRLAYIRRQWTLLDSLKSTSPDSYLKRFIETFREHAFATLSALTTVFGPDTTGAAQFAREVISEFTAVVNKELPRVEDRSAFLLQLTYCSYSLGKIGVEFWPLVDLDIPDEEWTAAFENQQEVTKAAIKASEPKASEPEASEP